MSARCWALRSLLTIATRWLLIVVSLHFIEVLSWWYSPPIAVATIGLWVISDDAIVKWMPCR